MHITIRSARLRGAKRPANDLLSCNQLFERTEILRFPHAVDRIIESLDERLGTEGTSVSSRLYLDSCLQLQAKISRPKSEVKQKDCIVCPPWRAVVEEEDALWVIPVIPKGLQKGWRGHECVSGRWKVGERDVSLHLYVVLRA